MFKIVSDRLSKFNVYQVYYSLLFIQILISNFAVNVSRNTKQFLIGDDDERLKVECVIMELYYAMHEIIHKICILLMSYNG